MRLLNFLNENITTEISLPIFLEELKKNCSNSIKDIKDNKFYIYKGIKTKDEFLFFDGKTKRKSAYTQNYYTLLFSDILKSWKGVPRRDHSLICTTNKEYAYGYGIVYIVFPYDNVKNFAVSNSVDFWDILENIKDKKIKNSFEYSKFTTLGGLTDIFYKNNVPENLQALKKYLNENSVYSILLEALKYPKFDMIRNRYLMLLINLALAIQNKDAYDIISKFSNDSEYKTMLENIMNIYEKELKIKLIDLWEECLNKDKLGIEIKNYNELKNSKKTEVWFDKPAILIREDLIPKILESL